MVACAPTAVVEVLHAEAAHVFDEGLDFLIVLHRLVAGVVDVNHVRHKAASEKTAREEMSSLNCHMNDTAVFPPLTSDLLVASHTL